MRPWNSSGERPSQIRDSAARVSSPVRSLYQSGPRHKPRCHGSASRATGTPARPDRRQRTTTPIGILAGTGRSHQVRGRNGLGHLPCLRHGRYPVTSMFTTLVTPSFVAHKWPARVPRQASVRSSRNRREGNRTFFDRAVLSHAVRQAQDGGIVGARVSINRDAVK